MLDNQETYELIERYLNEELTAQERMLFEKRLKEEPDLKTQTDTLQKVNEWVVLAGMSQDKVEINKAEKKFVLRQNYLNTGKWLLGGLVILSLSISLYILFKPSNKVTLSKPPSERSIDAVNPSEPKVKPKPSIVSAPDQIFKPNISPLENTPTTISPIVVEKQSNIEQSPIETEKTTRYSSEPESINNPCVTPLNAFFNSIPTCPSKNEGSILLTKIENAKEPVEISLNNESFKPGSSFNFLGEGDYIIVVKDANGCISPGYKISVQTKYCAIQKDIVFSYTLSQNWEFPEFEASYFQFVIFNVAGEKLNTINVQDNYPYSWNGLDRNENKLPLGTYPYKIISSSGNILYQGMFTIVD